MLIFSLFLLPDYAMATTKALFTPGNRVISAIKSNQIREIIPEAPELIKKIFA